jgi:hypothetical protein
MTEKRAVEGHFGTAGLLPFAAIFYGGSFVFPFDPVRPYNHALPLSAPHALELALPGLVSASAGTRQYQVAIPKTASVRLFLDTLLTVVDANSVAVPIGQPSLTISAGGQAAVTTNLTVP